MLLDLQPPPALLPTRSSVNSSTLWVVAFGVGRALLLALMLLVGLGVLSNCSPRIEKVILYNTETCPNPRPT